MKSTPTASTAICNVGTAAVAVCRLGGFTPCPEEDICFDETGGGSGHATFLQMWSAYDGFVGGHAEWITFNDPPNGTTLADQYAASLTVSFLNTAQGRNPVDLTLHWEGGTECRNLTGYNGSYMPHGDKVFVTFQNYRKKSPFTIVSDDPVALMGRSPIWARMERLIGSRSPPMIRTASSLPATPSARGCRKHHPAA